MLKIDELKVLKVLFDDLTKKHTIQSIAKSLKQKYPQTYHTVHNMAKKGDIIIEKIGNYKFVNLNLKEFNYNYVLAEMERAKDVIKKNIDVRIIMDNLRNIKKNFVCILFGSQVEKRKKNSDIDLLFLIPEEYDYGNFEMVTHHAFIVEKIDVNIAFDKSLHEMLAHPEKFNVGNELLKKHVVLYGAEHFLNLLRKHYTGD